MLHIKFAKYVADYKGTRVSKRVAHSAEATRTHDIAASKPVAWGITIRFLILDHNSYRAYSPNYSIKHFSHTAL
jgi:hypothetical protein